MTKWEAQSDSDGSDLSVREGLGNLLKHKGMLGAQGRGRGSNRGQQTQGL